VEKAAHKKVSEKVHLILWLLEIVLYLYRKKEQQIMVIGLIIVIVLTLLGWVSSILQG